MADDVATGGPDTGPTPDAAIVATAPPAPEHEAAVVEPIQGNEPGETWQEPQSEANTGIAIDGEHGLPLNHRLRAERLADEGKKEDPGGLISPEVIADAKDRLAGEAKAAKAAKGKDKA